jgi:hypothetical protein
MKGRIQVIIEDDDGQVLDTHDVFSFQRKHFQPEQAGLTLAEAKGTLHGLQQTVVHHQVDDFLQEQRSCPACGQQRRQKGKHTLVYRTLFGSFHLPSPRLYRCYCQQHGPRSFSPLAKLLVERTAPELLDLETKWAALIPYRATSELLADVLPLDYAVSTSVLRHHVPKVAQRMEGELGEERYLFITAEENEDPSLPDPAPPLTVGLDGGYVHRCEQPNRQEGWFEVIVGKSITADGDAKCVAFVHKRDSKPKRRIFELLKSQGVHANQPVTFLSDGGETVRNLQLYLNPLAEHLLDWFHVSMKLTVMGQMNKGMQKVEARDLINDVEKQLESLKHHLWNGNITQALRLIDYLQLLLKDDTRSLERKKLLKAVREFGRYIATNQQFIPDYGDRYRNDETITTSFVDSAVNQVVSKRFVKAQQMRWSQRGAHLLLQVRTHVLNKELRARFQQWYPGMADESEPEMRVAA